jgi:GNAT superfamily N-acetyltransferase
VDGYQLALNVLPMSQFRIRLATRGDLDVISDHRTRMFTDMGELPADKFETFRVQSKDTLRSMFEQNQYVGWVASPHDEPEKIVAGAGVTLRKVAPHPQQSADGSFDIVSGRQAIIQNVYTEPAWRRRGLGTLLMKEIIAWSQKTGIESLVLHASEEGRPLYEKLGFVNTTEMRFNG